MQVTIVLPCYNEVGHVEAEIVRITKAMDASGYVYDLDVYDDMSSDGTRDLLAKLEPRFPRMRYLPRHRNGGSGTIRRIGTQNARGEFVVWTDADMTYPNERIPEFVALLENDASIDQVVGARTSEEGTYKFLRVPAKWVIRKIASYSTATQIPDLNSGLRAFRRSVSLPYLRLLPPGFSCVTTLTVSFLSNNHDVSYVPITYEKRAGVSKFHFTKDAYRYILQVAAHGDVLQPDQGPHAVGAVDHGPGFRQADHRRDHPRRPGHRLDRAGDHHRLPGGGAGADRRPDRQVPRRLSAAALSA